MSMLLLSLLNRKMHGRRDSSSNYPVSHLSPASQMERMKRLKKDLDINNFISNTFFDLLGDLFGHDIFGHDCAIGSFSNFFCSTVESCCMW